MEEQEIRLDEVFYALKKRWVMIISLTLAVASISAVFSFFIIKPKYEAETKIFIGKDESDSQGYSQSDVTMYQNLLKTYSEVIKTKDLTENAINNSKLDLEVNNVLANVNVTTVASTQIIKISYQSTSPDEAKKILEEITNEFIQSSKTLIPNGNIQIIEKVQYPENPISPNKKMNIGVAGALGLMLGVGIALLIEFLDNTYKTKDQLERELDIPVLGLIPETKGM